MKRHAGKKGVNPQWQLFELLRRELWHWASFVVNECFYLDVAPTISQLPSCRPLLDRRIGVYTRQFSRSLWRQRVQGQHSLSATIIFATIATHLRSPETRKAYPSGSSSVLITADLNLARSVATRSRSSALVKQQAIGMSSEPCFMAGSRAERRRSCADTRPFVRNGQKHARWTPPPMP